MTSFESDLVAVVGAAHVLTDPEVVASFGTDWTRRWSGRPRAVVRPGSTDEVAAVVRVCARHGVPVVPQGGNTGLVGGGVPRGDGEMVVVSTTRLQRLDPVETATARAEVVAGAGVTLSTLEAHARAAGHGYGVDLAARDTATIGGTVATNAGGLRVVGHGDTRAQVLGVEAVLPDGSVVSRLGGLAKDNGGYDLSRLLVGSEGTLGIVTAVRVRLIPRPAAAPFVTLVGLPDVASGVALLDQRGLTGAELFDDAGMRVVCEVAGLALPTARHWPYYLVLETAELPELGGRSAASAEGSPVGSAIDSAEPDAVVDPRMWAYRDRQAEAVASLGVPHKLDVCLPVAGLADFVAALDPVLDGVLAAAAAADSAADRSADSAADSADSGGESAGESAPTERLQRFVYGHVGDGNLHINVIGLPDEDESLESAVLPLVAAHHGSIAAEHGVGVAKVDWLPLSRSAAELAAMRSLKAALDPAGLLNPGVLLG